MSGRGQSPPAAQLKLWSEEGTRTPWRSRFQNQVDAKGTFGAGRPPSPEYPQGPRAGSSPLRRPVRSELCFSGNGAPISSSRKAAGWASPVVGGRAHPKDKGWAPRRGGDIPGSPQAPSRVPPHPRGRVLGGLGALGRGRGVRLRLNAGDAAVRSSQVRLRALSGSPRQEANSVCRRPPGQETSRRASLLCGNRKARLRVPTPEQS